MAEAARTPAIGTEGLEGAVTTPAESAAIATLRKMLQERKTAAGRVTLASMIGGIEIELAAREAGARATLQVYGAISGGALDQLLALEATIDFLQKAAPLRKQIWKLMEAADGARG